MVCMPTSPVRESDIVQYRLCALFLLPLAIIEMGMPNINMYIFRYNKAISNRGQLIFLYQRSEYYNAITASHVCFEGRLVLIFLFINNLKL